MASPNITVMAKNPRTGSAPWNLPLETLDGISAADYARRFKNKIKQAQDHDRYDTLRIEAASTVPRGIKALFGVPKDGDFKSASGNLIVKDSGDTNMVEGYKMEFESYMLVESIQVQATATAHEFNALSAGQPTDLAPAAAGVVSSANTVIGISLNTFLQFRVGDEVKAEGLLPKFPCEYSFSGAYGGAADEGFTQIGVGVARPLRQVVLLKPGQNFVVTLDFLRALVVPQSIQLRVYLSGTLFESVG